MRNFQSLTYKKQDIILSNYCIFKFSLQLISDYQEHNNY